MPFTLSGPFTTKGILTLSLSEVPLPDWSAPIEQKFQSTDIQAGDEFGGAVAMNSSGNTLIVGATAEDEGGTDAGAAYIFTRSGNTWTQQQKILSSDIEAVDRFGWTVALSSDGNTAIVGAVNNNAGGNNSGAAYVFTRSGNTWTQQQKLQSTDIQANDNFGSAVSMSGDGSTAVISSPGKDTGGSNAGAAYIFTRSGSTWTQQQKLVASDAQTEDQFSWSVAMSLNGNVAAVGAKYKNGVAAGAGAVYVFTRSGGTWTEQQKLISPVAPGFQSQFGNTLSLSANGTRLAVGNERQDKGKVFVYELSGGTWSYTHTLESPDPGAGGGFFGSSIQMNDAGTVMAIAEPNNSLTGLNRGAVHVFGFSAGAWTRLARLQGSDVANSQFFSDPVSIDGSGDTVIAGAQTYKNAAYVYMIQ